MLQRRNHDAEREKRFSHVGFGQVSGIIAILLVSLAMAPLATPDTVPKAVATLGPSVLLMVYFPNAFP